MRSDFVVVACVRLQNLAQMGLAQDNDVVQALTPNRSDQPFGKAILPGRGWCGRLVPDAHGTESAYDNGTVDFIAIPNHAAGSPVPRKGLGDLTCDPLRCRVCCDVDPDEISAMKPHNHEAVEYFEAN